MPTVLITGGTGMIGKALTSFLIDNGFNIIIATRQAPKEKRKGVTYIEWNVRQQTIDSEAISKADHIIHLAGAGVADERWSDKRKREIVDSRVQGGNLLVKAMEFVPNNIKTVISASGIGWYGPDTTTSKQYGFKEAAPADKDFLGNTCLLWENSIHPAQHLGKRVVVFRQGIVLSEKGGALEEFKKPLRLGMAAILGDGKQVISWIHVHDLCRMFLYAITNEQLHGVYNAVTPNPVTNKELTLTLARARNGRFFFRVHVPAFVLKMVLGEMSIEVLKSATVSSEKITAAGFAFHYATIEKALQSN